MHSGGKSKSVHRPIWSLKREGLVWGKKNHTSNPPPLNQNESGVFVHFPLIFRKSPFLLPPSLLSPHSLLDDLASPYFLSFSPPFHPGLYKILPPLLTCQPTKGTT